MNDYINIKFKDGDSVLTTVVTTTMKCDPYQVKPYLLLPENYDPVKAEKHNNGCGPAGWKGKAVPETNYGIRISDCCHVHDFEYGERVQFCVICCERAPLFKDFEKPVKKHIKKMRKEGRIFLDSRNVADLRMWSNHLLIIKKEAKWSRFLNIFRRRRAKTYYWFVDEMGGKEFKN